MLKQSNLLAILIISITPLGVFGQNRNEKALSYFEQANIKYQVSPGHYSDSLAKSCLSLYTKAIELNPKFWQAYRNRSRLYSDLKLYKKAILDINIALKYAGSDNFYYLIGMRGDNYYKNGNYESAVKDYSHAIPNEGNPSYHFLMRAKSKWKLGLKEQACKDYQIAIKGDPNLAKDQEFLKCN